MLEYVKLTYGISVIAQAGDGGHVGISSRATSVAPYYIKHISCVLRKVLYEVVRLTMKEAGMKNKLPNEGRALLSIRAGAMK